MNRKIETERYDLEGEANGKIATQRYDLEGDRKIDTKIYDL